MALRKCACIDTLYTELPFLQRLAAAKRDGFDGVDFWEWRPHDLAQLRAAAEDCGIRIHSFDGDADFSLVDPAHKARYLDFLGRSLEAARFLGAESLTIHSNALDRNGQVIDSYDGLSDTVKLCAMYDTLLDCARMAERSQIRLNLEALNVTTDHPGNFLTTTQMSAEVCRLIGSPWLKILYDVYHMQISEGSLCDHIAAYCDQIGHVHAADVPGRHEPGTGEINYPRVLEQLERCGYTGCVGFELFPQTDTAAAVQAIMKL